MGLHVGPVQAEARDFAPNHTLNRVARVMSAGHGGQILLTLAVVELVRRRLPDGVRLKDLGQYYLKGLSQPEHLFQVVLPDLPAEFPPLNAEDYFPHNLPDPLTSFIGREREVAHASTCSPIAPTWSGNCWQLVPTFAFWLAAAKRATQTGLVLG